MSGCVTIYGRLSQSLGDPADLDIYAHQIEPLKRLAAADGFHIACGDVLCEVGTGEFIAARPTFAGWLEAVERLPEGVGGVVYVTEIARLSRGSMTERGRIFDALVRAGIKIRTPSRWYDLTNPDDELWFAFMSSVGRHEQGRAKERIGRWFEKMARQGKIPTGGDRYGYRWDKEQKTLVPEAAEFAVVKQLFVEAFHLSSYALARRYGLPPSSIYKILRDPVYCGWPARHSRAVMKDGRRHAVYLKREEWTWPEQAGDYPAAVSRADFERLQAHLAARWCRREKTGSTGWCRSLVRFEGHAGEVRLGSEGWNGERVLTYELWQAGRRRLNIARALVHEAAESAVLAALSRPLVLLEAWEAYQAAESARRAVAASGASPAAIREALEKERRTLARLALQEAEADAEGRAAAAAAARLVRGRIEALKVQLRAATTETPAPSPLTGFIQPAAGQIERRWLALPAAQKAVLAGLILAAVVVRVTPQPHPARWLREVVAVEVQAWVPSSGE